MPVIKGHLGPPCNFFLFAFDSTLNVSAACSGVKIRPVNIADLWSNSNLNEIPKILRQP